MQACCSWPLPLPHFCPLNGNFITLLPYNPPTMYCPSCGSEERQLSQFCRACGTDLRIVRNSLESPDASRSRRFPHANT